MEMMTIDGSEGEGGGQILRSSMALAVLSATPIHIINIRAGRKKPGLKRQHVTSVQAAAHVCGGAARLEGCELESSELTFDPAPAHPAGIAKASEQSVASAGTHHFSVGSAGSAMLVFQTVLPILLRANGPSTVVLEGGTHNEMAPTFDFLDRCFLPWVRTMGAQIEVTLERYGFFPAGGGKVVVHVEPPTHLAGFNLLERGSLKARSDIALLSKLSDDVGQRQLKTLTRLLTTSGPRNANLVRVDSDGPGTVCMVELQFDHVTEIVTGFGRRGVSSEKIAKQVVSEAQAYVDHGAPVGEHLADQLLMPLALSACEPADASVPRGGSFRAGPLSLHTTTHIDILQRFLPVSITVEPDAGSPTSVVSVAPASV